MTGTVLYPWLFSVPWFPTDSRHHSCDTGGPRHRRRQRTLECGPAGPAQQHGTSVPSSSGRTSTRHRSLSSRYICTPSFLMLKMELLLPREREASLVVRYFHGYFSFHSQKVSSFPESLAIIDVEGHVRFVHLRSFRSRGGSGPP